MRTAAFSTCLALLSFVDPLLAVTDPEPPGIGAAPVAGAALVAPWITRPELHQARASLTNLNKIKGDFGENLVAAHLRESGGWKKISPGFGVHGPDHVTMKFDRDGRPRDVFFWDAKYGTSRPGPGQSSEARLRQWTSHLAADYRSIAAAAARPEPAGLDATRRMVIDTPGGPSAVAWKDDSGRVWLHSTVERDDAIRRQANRIAAYLDGVGSDQARIRRRFISITPSERGLQIEFSRPVQIPWEHATVRRALIKSISDALPPSFSPAEKAELAQQLATRVAQQRDINSIGPGRGDRAWRYGGAGIVGAALDFALRMGGHAVTGDAIDLRTAVVSACLSGSSLAAAILVEDGAVVATRQVLSSVARHASPATRVAASRLVGGVVGSGVAVVVYSYGGWLAGLHDVTNANQGALAGGIGMAAGAVFTASVTGLIGAFGTASTGTAIGSLSGAAANGATLAWLGGGSVAAGGGGVAVGTIVLSGGAAIVVVVATTTVLYYFDWRASQDQETDSLARIEGLKIHYERMLQATN